MTSLGLGKRAWLVVGLALLGFAACGQDKGASSLEEPVSVSTQALEPANWTPAALLPSAWYVASPGDVVVTDGRVERWVDRTTHHNDAVQDFAPGRPVFNTTGWNGQPTVTFQAQNLLTVDDWNGAPAGTDAGFTVL